MRTHIKKEKCIVRKLNQRKFNHLIVLFTILHTKTSGGNLKPIHFWNPMWCHSHYFGNVPTNTLGLRYMLTNFIGKICFRWLASVYCIPTRKEIPICGLCSSQTLKLCFQSLNHHLRTEECGPKSTNQIKDFTEHSDIWTSIFF